MPQTNVFTTRSTEETKALGRKYGKKIKAGGILALEGDLGSGKTTFTQGVATGLGLRSRVASPTFVKMVRHRIPKTRRYFYHFDIYRLRHVRDLDELGFSEIIRNKENIILIEWPEKVKRLLPARTSWIHFSHDQHHAEIRNIKIS